MLALTNEQIQFFQRHGYLLVPDFIDPTLALQVAARFENIFRGEFETTTPPDEWRWCEGKDPNDVTRMIWNGWKSDLTIAQLSLHEKVGYYCAKLSGWHGARLNQDGCLWKPPGAKGLAFHQDANYINWILPHDMITCWIALDDTDETSGTLEYVLGSHHWGLGHRPEDFHDPNDYRHMVLQHALALGVTPEFLKVCLPRGGAAFHHRQLWHGSGPNLSKRDRRALALHCMPDHAQFHPTNPAFAQGRYRKFDDTTMEPSFYPILWTDTGGRSPFIETYLKGEGRAYRTHRFK